MAWYPRWLPQTELSAHELPKTINTAALTVVYIQYKESFPISKRTHDVEFEPLTVFTYLPEIPLIVLVRFRGSRIRTEVDIEVVEHVGEEFKL